MAIWLELLEIPLSVGIVGGIANVHPVLPKYAQKYLESHLHSRTCMCNDCNRSCLKTIVQLGHLSTEGIQKGHMRLHARNLAAAAGATPEQIDQIVHIMIDRKENFT